MKVGSEPFVDRGDVHCVNGNVDVASNTACSAAMVQFRLHSKACEAFGPRAPIGVPPFTPENPYQWLTIGNKR